jgi:preprotein translocase subunit SecE
MARSSYSGIVNQRCSGGARAAVWRREKETVFEAVNPLAKINPGEFIRQVRAETARVTWPTSRETVMTAVMVLIMTTILGLFFFGVDSFFSWAVKSLLSLLNGN